MVDLIDGVEMQSGPPIVFQGCDDFFAMGAGGGVKQKTFGLLGRSRPTGKDAGSEGLFVSLRLAGLQAGKGQGHDCKQKQPQDGLLEADQQVKNKNKGKNAQAVGAEGLCHQVLETDQDRLNSQTGEEQGFDELRQVAQVISRCPQSPKNNLKESQSHQIENQG